LRFQEVLRIEFAKIVEIACDLLRALRRWNESKIAEICDFAAIIDGFA
jgi:hypothetical protein